MKSNDRLTKLHIMEQRIHSLVGTPDASSQSRRERLIVEEGAGVVYLRAMGGDQGRKNEFNV